ncbi:MAG: phytanoyl-CoA dioxygenase family protein [Cellvibrionaceae bacterium]|nr:phytanoyl-CoA dioxygenase family protein [Cellvibrionaceae bacterium]
MNIKHSLQNFLFRARRYLHLNGSKQQSVTTQPKADKQTPSLQLKGQIQLSALQDTQEVAGLCKVLYTIQLQDGENLADNKLELQVLDQNNQVLHQQPLDAEQMGEENWLALNSHRLDNGALALKVQLLVDGQAQLAAVLNMTIDNSGELAERVKDSLARAESPKVITGDCNTTLFNFGDEAVVPWFDRADAKQRLAAKAEKDPFVKEHLNNFNDFLDEGYMVVSGWLDDEFIDKLNSEMDDAVAKKIQDYEIGSSQRIMGLHNRYQNINKLWRLPKVLQMLEHIFEDAPRPCQTLTYVYGSQQSYHQDTVHLTPFPAGYMCGVWVALEDIQAGSGELRVLKGSHRLPRIYRETVDCPQVFNNQWDQFATTVDQKWQDMINDNNFEEMSYLAKKGDILIWHENLMHGGSLRENIDQSRRSIVSHYFAKGGLGFYDSSGMPAILL